MKGDRFFEVMITEIRDKDEAKLSFREKCKTFEGAYERGKKLLAEHDNINIEIWEWEYVDEFTYLFIRATLVAKES